MAEHLNVASIFFGVFIGIVPFTILKVLKQTYFTYRHRGTRTIRNHYVVMVWAQMVVNMMFAPITYLYLRGIMEPSLEFYLLTVTFWALQTQLLPQIVANRVGLIMFDKRQVQKLKWYLFIAVGCINISVYCIWITAMMLQTPKLTRLNFIWEHFEKTFFLTLDLSLNLYFLYLVRSKLIANGLTKYWTLYNFNVVIIGISTSMDALLLGLMSLPNSYDYIQFAPIAYLVKLNIELAMGELIINIVRSTNQIDILRLNRFEVSDSVHLNNDNEPRQPNDIFDGTTEAHTTTVCSHNEDEPPARLGHQTRLSEIMKTVTVEQTNDDISVVDFEREMQISGRAPIGENGRPRVQSWEDQELPMFNQEVMKS